MRAEAVDTRLLLIAEQIVELGQRGLHRAQGLQHCVEPLLHSHEPTGRRQRLLRLAVRLEDVGRFGQSVVEFLERGLLRITQAKRPLDLLGR